MSFSARPGSSWPVSIEDWAQAATAKLAAGPRGYIFGGAGAGDHPGREHRGVLAVADRPQGPGDTCET